MSRPSHHLRATWHSAWSRCKFKPGEGVAVIKDPAKGADTERSRALLTGEEEENSIWSSWSTLILFKATNLPPAKKTDTGSGTLPETRRLTTLLREEAMGVGRGMEAASSKC